MDLFGFLEEKHNIILSEQQQKGVLCIKNTLLLAVPGSGKTTVLVSRLANLILNHHVPCQKILTLTFSRETAKDMKRRYTDLFYMATNQMPQFKTIHSFCLRVLRYYAEVYQREMPRLISDSETNNLKAKVLRDIYKHHNEEYLTDDILETLDRMISYAKNRMLSIEQMAEQEKELASFVKIFQDYEAYKKKSKLIDYDDMLTYTYDIFLKLPRVLEHFRKQYSYINVDEAQDTSLIQHEIIKLLAYNNTVFMVGDEDQSIYSFRGAYPKALLDFKSLYQNADVIKMEHNYRSNADIVSKANDFIKQNKQRYDKEMVCNNQKTNSIRVVELKDYANQFQATVDYIKTFSKDKTLAIIYRNNESAIPMIDLFYRHGIDFYCKEHKITYFTSFVLRDIVSYLNLAFVPRDITSFRQIYYKLGLSKGAFEFVEKNIKRYDSVFLCAAEISSLSDNKRNQMRYYHSAFKRMISMQPHKAIECIQDTLGYQNYIEKRLNDGFTKTSAYQKISTAIQLAQGVDTIHDYLDKSNQIQAYMSEQKNIDKKANITLTTLHSSKGLEFDCVILLDMIKDIIPTSEAVNNQLFGELDEIENETRLFYVGVTRAKSELILFKSHCYNGAVTLPSRYIDRFINGTVSIKSSDRKPKPQKGIVPNIKGKIIEHSYFGTGIVLSQQEETITVNFKMSGQKSLNYFVCIQADVLKIKE